MLLLAAAGCSENGAHFTLSAPEGPETAASFRVILATPESIPSIANQRVSPDAMATQTVPYYLQRTVASEAKIDQVDGLRIKLEASFAMNETTFIPFVLLFDDQGGIVGIGTYRADGQTMPAPVLVMPNEIDKYTLDVEPVTIVDDMTRAAPGQVQVVDCFHDDQTTYTSGIVWRPKAGGELRILFPNDGSLDATSRTLDLDCDNHDVTAESSGRDCDDTRGWFHRDAQETCDGYDTNCDGLQNTVVACTGTPGGGLCPDPTTGTGIALCDDRTGTASACQSDPACLCADGATGCVRCSMLHAAGTTAGNVVPCQPGIGTVTTLGLCSENEPCTVEILAVRGGWKAEIATDVNNQVFGYKATNVGYRFVLKAKRPEGAAAEIPGVAGQSTGEVDLAITPLGRPAHLLAVDLAFKNEPPTVCQGTGPYQMYCTP
jgi:hypothetical protein